MQAISKQKSNSKTPDIAFEYQNTGQITANITTPDNANTHNGFLKEPGSAITHLIGIILSTAGMFPLMSKAANSDIKFAPIASGVFILSMILLYLASTLYHSIYASEKVTCILQKFDHIMIYFLIAGTYTPICILALPKTSGIPLLMLIWLLTICGLVLTVFWINSPKWLNSTIYIIMGWLCIFAFKPLFTAISLTAFGWLFTGGVIYTIGGIIYALKLPMFNEIHKNFGSHEVFHLFVLGGSICHYYMIYTFLL